MISLKADNRSLLIDAKSSYLAFNYASGVTTMEIVNANSFADDDFILLGNFGSETAEIVQIDTVTASTNSFTLVAATKFAHSESTQVTILKYNTVQFYNAPTTTFITSNPVTSYIDIQADDFYTTTYDSVNTSGFGFFRFYNTFEVPYTYSQESNPIPYIGFDDSSVKQILDSFFSMLNNNELKLISLDDAFSWLNEGYNITKNELNLVNEEYEVGTPEPISVVAGTSEYELPTDFSEVLSLFDSTNKSTIPFISLENAPSYGASNTTDGTRYYIRGDYIGFTPEPTASATYLLTYKKKLTVLESYDDEISLPNNEYSFLKDYMLYRALQKLQRSAEAMNYKGSFFESVNRMKLDSHKRDNNKDSWEHDPTTLV